MVVQKFEYFFGSKQERLFQRLIDGQIRGGYMQINTGIIAGFGHSSGDIHDRAAAACALQGDNFHRIIVQFNLRVDIAEQIRKQKISSGSAADVQRSLCGGDLIVRHSSGVLLGDGARDVHVKINIPCLGQQIAQHLHSGLGQFHSVKVFFILLGERKIVNENCGFHATAFEGVFKPGWRIVERRGLIFRGQRDVKANFNWHWQAARFGAVEFANKIFKLQLVLGESNCSAFHLHSWETRFQPRWILHVAGGFNIFRQRR